MATEKTVISPMMKQFAEIKMQYPDCILFYRVGDFYETFGEDAVTTSKVLGLVLTRKAVGGGSFTELAGVPHHAIDTYLPKLVEAGYKVAVCDQLEDPRFAKKIVKRGVTELVTPGVSFNDSLLKESENNYLCACFFEGDKGGAAFLDVSTGTFKVAEGSLDYIEVLLNDFSPKEVLLSKGYKEGYVSRFGSGYYITTLDDWAFSKGAGEKKLLTHFGLETLSGFGINGMAMGITAAAAILFYMDLTEHKNIDHIKSISRVDKDDFVWVDKFTFRNLEVFNSLAGAQGVSLIQSIDRTSSPLGARKLREWLAMPLKNPEDIKARHDVVEAVYDNEPLCNSLREKISNIGDLERIVSKAAAGRIAPREVLQLCRGLKSIACIIADGEQEPAIKKITERLNGLEKLVESIEKTILPDAAVQIGKGSVIARGVSAELDDYRNVLENSKDILLNIQQEEREKTGISSLKISYNNVFGYYLEVRNMHSEKVPAEWIRKQTLVNAERYITPELKEYESKIFNAEEKILEIENSIYTELVSDIQHNISAIQRNAQAVAELDCLSCFAFLARERNYCRPVVDDSLVIDIKQGRHPVIENLMKAGEQYVANDLHLDNEKNQIIILTGPNMSGKSAFLRQTALIVLMAQIGSFVPAKSARIGYIDKLFTRVGASDNISRGESTFMVEMLETATILNNLSQRSLVLLDEIGRGTSTYDGMSIAWAIVEYLHNSEMKKGVPYAPKTLFATHYHELNALEKQYPRVHNFHISTKEVEGNIIFLRHLEPGGVATSFGIHVARLAGMPFSVVRAAETKLKHLEETAGKSSKEIEDSIKHSPIQLSLYQLDDPLLVEIRDILSQVDINSLSPLEAFDTIRHLKEKMEGKKWTSSKT